MARRLAQEGALVVGGDLAGRPRDSTGDIYRAYAHLDVRDLSSVTSLVQLAAQCGDIAVLVNTVGINARSPIEDYAVGEWDRVIEVNLRGTALAIKEVVPFMKRAGSGSIINLASTAALMPTSSNNSAYVTSKGGIVALTKALVYELSGSGIRVNAVAPGVTNTPLIARNDRVWLDRISSMIPMGRIAEPSEIADLVLFLASDASSYITGQTIAVDGGMSSVVFNG